MNRFSAPIGLLAMLLLLLPASLAASETLPVTTLGVGKASQVVFGLLLVLVVIAVLAWLYRRQGGFRPASNPQLSVMASLSLSARERLVLVRVCGVQLLLGVAPGQIRTLHVLGEISEQDEPPAIDSKPNLGFKDLLAKASGSGCLS